MDAKTTYLFHDPFNNCNFVSCKDKILDED